MRAIEGRRAYLLLLLLRPYSCFSLSALAAISPSLRPILLHFSPVFFFLFAYRCWASAPPTPEKEEYERSCIRGGGMVGGRRNYSDLDTRRIRLRRPTAAAAAAQGPMGGRQGSCSERNASPPPPPSLPLSLCVSGLLSPPLGLGRYNKGEINPLSDPSAVPPPFLWLRQRPPPTDEDDRPDSHSVVALRRLLPFSFFPFSFRREGGGGGIGALFCSPAKMDR